jgi:archaellin
MRKNITILCFVLLVVIIFFSGCITQNMGYPIATQTQQIVNGNPQIATASPQILKINLPITPPPPQVVYVTVTVPVSDRTMVPVPISAETSGKTVCKGSENATADIMMTGNVYGISSVPAEGIDEIKFTLGLAPCSPALDLTKLQIVFSTLNAPPVTLMQSTRTSTNFFTTKIGTTKVTSLNPGDQVEITFFVTPISANTRMNIELKPSGGVTLPFTKTAPATIAATNILQ